MSGFADIADDLADSTAEITIQTASVDTRNEHLRSADFFDVETYPEIRFVSSAIDEVDEGSYIVTGDLTIRDMTKTVSIPLELIGVDTDPFGNLRAGLEGSRRIDRKDWGVTWNTKLDSGGVLVSDKITLEFELSLIKNLDEAAPVDSSETTDENEAPTETPEPVTEATPVPKADTAAPQAAAPITDAPENSAEAVAPKTTPPAPEAPKAPESVTPTPAADETAPPAPKAPESAASVAPNSEPAGTEFPPPPPVKPAETHADKPAEKAPEAKQSGDQSSGSTFGKLFGLR